MLFVFEWWVSYLFSSLLSFARPLGEGDQRVSAEECLLRVERERVGEREGEGGRARGFWGEGRGTPPELSLRCALVLWAATRRRDARSNGRAADGTAESKKNPHHFSPAGAWAFSMNARASLTFLNTSPAERFLGGRSGRGGRE